MSAKAKELAAVTRPFRRGMLIKVSDDPLRPRDWRWKRIMYLMQRTPGTNRTKPCTSVDDKHIREAKEYLRERDRICSNITVGSTEDLDYALMPLRRRWPAIMQAHAIWEEAGFRRWVTEALVLASVSAEDIASEFGCDPSIIEAYELFFYDIRSRLVNELFIVGELLAPALVDDSATASRDSDFFWKAIAYRGGADMVRTFFSYKAIPEKMRQDIMGFIGDMEYRNIAKAATARPVNNYTAHELMDEHLQRRQLEEGNQVLTDTAEQMVAGAQAMLGAVGFAVASVGNVGTSPIEERISKTIKVLADDDNSGNNDNGDSTKRLPPANIMAERLARRGDAPQGEEQKSERVPISDTPKRHAKSRPTNAVVVEPATGAEVAAAEAVQAAKEASASKKAAALKHIKSKGNKK